MSKPMCPTASLKGMKIKYGLSYKLIANLLNIQYAAAYNLVVKRDLHAPSYVLLLHRLKKYYLDKIQFFEKQISNIKADLERI